MSRALPICVHDAQADRLAAPLFATIADEIRDIRGLLEGLAEVLVSDERLTMDYLEPLQAFDLVIQRADEAADLLDRVASGSTAADAIAHIRLGVVQDRFRAALAG